MKNPSFNATWSWEKSHLPRIKELLSREREFTTYKKQLFWRRKKNNHGFICSPRCKKGVEQRIFVPKVLTLSRLLKKLLMSGKSWPEEGFFREDCNPEKVYFFCDPRARSDPLTLVNTSTRALCARVGGSKKGGKSGSQKLNGPAVKKHTSFVW